MLKHFFCTIQVTAVHFNNELSEKPMVNQYKATIDKENEEEKAKKVFLEDYEKYIARLHKEGKITKKEKEEWLAKAASPTGAVFSFNSEEDAKNFFTQQAKAGHKFIACKDDGSYYASNGNGELFEGKIDVKLFDKLQKYSKEFHSNPKLETELFNALKDGDESQLKLLIQKAQKISLTEMRSIDLQEQNSLGVERDNSCHRSLSM
ncbi:MAG: hypothetical protein LEGION0403_FIIPPAGN_02183 [Legionella sp.]|uniref:hypothetical protein n=1 Tax=Legionella sp. TaxID=459 RepID=UPI003D117B05